MFEAGPTSGLPTSAGGNVPVNGDPRGSSRATAADAHIPDKTRVRRLAGRAARNYEDAAWLPRQVADALMEHLAPVRIAPARVLDAGAGTGICSRLLAHRFRGARIIAVDSSAPMLRIARSRGSPDAVLDEFHRVLAPAGLLMFTSLGPDTLRELRESWMSVDPCVHVHGFIDMHDLGDALLRAGFQDVVMDTERFTGRYADVAALTGELKGLGSSNAARGSRKGLTTPDLVAAMARAYEQQRTGGSLPASFEVVFGHAWRAPRCCSTAIPAPPPPRSCTPPTRCALPTDSDRDSFRPPERARRPGRKASPEFR